MSKQKRDESQESDLDNFIDSMKKSLKAKDEDRVETFMSTGCTILDYLIANRRNGGIPAGRITEIAGEESSGKTLIASHVLANTQKIGGIPVYIDTEHAAQKTFMERVGVNWDKVLRPKPSTIEEVFDTIESIVAQAREKFDNTKPLTIVWDSIAATPPKAEIEGDYDPNSLMGVAAKAMSKGMRKLTEVVDYGNVTLLFLNQLRFKMNLENKYADPWVTPYGKAVPFHASTRIRLNSFSKIKEDESISSSEVVGIWTRAEIKKSRLSPPMRRAEFPIMFSHGIDDAMSIYRYLHEHKGLIEKAQGKTKITLDGKDYAFPHDQWREFLKENRLAVDDLLEKLLVVNYDPNDEEGATKDKESELE